MRQSLFFARNTVLRSTVTSAFNPFILVSFLLASWQRLKHLTLSRECTRLWNGSRKRHKLTAISKREPIVIKLFLVAAFLTTLPPMAVLSQTKLDDSSAWYAVKTTYRNGAGTCSPIYKPYKGAIRQSVSPTMRINTKTNPDEQVMTILVSAAPESNDWAVRVSVVFDGLYNQG